MMSLNDATVLSYTSAGGAGLPLLTKPILRRVTVVASEYALDSLLNLAGPVLLLYHDPDIQSLVYEASGVPSGRCGSTFTRVRELSSTVPPRKQ